MAYVALRTVGTDGVMITDQPTGGRILAESGDYLAVLAVCRAHRVTTYAHRGTGDVRTLTEAELVGCAVSDPALCAWVRGAGVVAHGEYAIPVPVADLPMYEP